MDKWEQTRELEALKNELEALKRKVGGYKTSNEKYRRQVDELKKQVEHYKALDIEGDRLYEEKIAECEALRDELDKERHTKCAQDAVSVKVAELQVALENKNGHIENLQARLREMIEERKKLDSTIIEQNQYIDEMECVISELSKPWWKRLFD